MCRRLIFEFCLELSEDKSLAIGQNADDGTAIANEDDQTTTFDVKYLGSTPVDSAADAVAGAVKTVLVMVSKVSWTILFLLSINTIYSPQYVILQY